MRIIYIIMRWVRGGRTHGLPLLSGGTSLGASLLLTLALLEEALRDQDLVVGGNGSASACQISTGPAYHGMQQSAGARIVAASRHSRFG